MTQDNPFFQVGKCTQTFSTDPNGGLIVHDPPKCKEPGEITLLREILETLKSIERKLSPPVEEKGVRV